MKGMHIVFAGLFLLMMWQLTKLCFLLLLVTLHTAAQFVAYTGELLAFLGSSAHTRLMWWKARLAADRAALHTACSIADVPARLLLGLGTAIRELGLFACGALNFGQEVGTISGQGMEYGRTKDGVHGSILPTGAYGIEVAGTEHYQPALTGVFGNGANEQSRRAQAVLKPDDSNRYDRKAVRVEIQGMLVGHLSRKNARQYRERLREDGHPALTLRCEAIVARQDNSKLCVKLDIPTEE